MVWRKTNPLSEQLMQSGAIIRAAAKLDREGGAVAKAVGGGHTPAAPVA